MNWVIITGIIIALMFLAAFTNWFYHLLAGTSALIVKDIYFGYRIFGWGFFAILIMAGVFWTNAMIQECPTPPEDREGVFVYLDCRVYTWAKTTTLGSFFPPPREVFEEPIEEPEQIAPNYPSNI